MTVTLALLAFGVVFTVVALASSRWTPLIGIGGPLIVIGAVKLLIA